MHSEINWFKIWGMCLDNALRDLAEHERQRVESRLQHLANLSGLAFQAVQNFRNETRLDRKCWSLLLQTLHDLPDPSTLREAVTGVLSLYTLNGSLISRSAGMRFGRAVTLKKFCHLLVSLGY